jgi:hypothetical protein
LSGARYIKGEGPPRHIQPVEIIVSFYVSLLCKAVVKVSTWPYKFICIVVVNILYLVAGAREDANSNGLNDLGLGGYGPQATSSPGKFANLVQETIVGSGTGVKKSAKRPLESSRRHAATQPLRTGLYDSLPPPERSKS